MSRMTTALGPAWVADPKRLTALRERAARRRIIRDLCRGDHRKVFVEMALSNHRYGQMMNNAGQLTELVAMFDLLSLAPDMHAAVLIGNPPVMTLPDGFEDQAAALASIASECMLDATLMEGVAQSVIDGETVLRVDRVPGIGTVIVTDSIETCLPVGPVGHNRQPTVWERRWVIERTIDRRRHEFLRVERHRVLNGVGVVEQEAYESRGLDLYTDLSKAKAVPLATAVPDNTPEPRTVTGLDRNTIVRFVRAMDEDGWPRMLLSKGSINVLDVHAAAFSRLARTMERHGEPKVRVSETMIDAETGKVDLTRQAIVDEEGIFEYILPGYDFASMMTWVKQTTQMILTSVKMSPSLLGIKLGDGAMPDTYDKLRLESTNTLVAARTAEPYLRHALQEIFWVASMVESTSGLAGWPVGEVAVSLSPEIPADLIDRARVWAEIKNSGLSDEEYAIRRLHGDGPALGIIERLAAQRASETARSQASMFGAGFGGGGGA